MAVNIPISPDTTKPYVNGYTYTDGLTNIGGYSTPVLDICNKSNASVQVDVVYNVQSGGESKLAINFASGDSFLVPLTSSKLLPSTSDVPFISSIIKLTKKTGDGSEVHGNFQLCWTCCQGYFFQNSDNFDELNIVPNGRAYVLSNYPVPSSLRDKVIAPFKIIQAPA